MKTSIFLACATLLATLSACNQDGGDGVTGDKPDTTFRTGLRSLVLAEGVDGFDYTVVPVDCASGTPVAGGSAITAHAELVEGLTLPASLATFISKPFEEGSTHHFADHFFTLPAGCYDVEVVPFGPEADKCSSAQAKNIEVLEGKTTEKMLISQCEGIDPGALDIIASLNHAPEISVVDFQPSKFFCVDASTELCVIASDPDADPLRYEVTFDAGVPCSAGDVTLAGDGGCFEITCSAAGSYVPHVKVYDQAYDSAGSLVDIEDLLPAFGGAPELTSHSSLDAIIHVGEGLDCDGIDTDTATDDTETGTGTDTATDTETATETETGTDSTATDTTATDSTSTSDSTLSSEGGSNTETDDTGTSTHCPD